MFVHTVYYWLKGDNKHQAGEAIRTDCESMLKKIPSVRHLWTGRPVPSKREVVDGSYDVGLCVIYDDKPGHDLYQEHPLHQEFLARHKPHFERIRVYDFQ